MITLAFSLLRTSLPIYFRNAPARVGCGAISQPQQKTCWAGVRSYGAAGALGVRATLQDRAADWLRLSLSAAGRVPGSPQIPFLACRARLALVSATFFVASVSVPRVCRGLQLAAAALHSPVPLSQRRSCETLASIESPRPGKEAASRGLAAGSLPSVAKPRAVVAATIHTAMNDVWPFMMPILGGC